MNRPLRIAGYFVVSTYLFLLSQPVVGAEKALPPAIDRKVDYLSDVKPIFENNCYSCHGPSKQKSGFRLDAAP
ncbi:MAG: hypothetical protein KC917_14185 [Candidatus Omnitrophica bacterium]|nr:hypothetical protein [Candidatus Omnitrophota bacterium]